MNPSGSEIHPKSRRDDLQVFSWNAVMRRRSFYLLRSRTLWTYFINHLFLPSELRQFHHPFCFVFSDAESSKNSNCSHFPICFMSNCHWAQHTVHLHSSHICSAFIIFHLFLPTLRPISHNHLSSFVFFTNYIIVPFSDLWHFRFLCLYYQLASISLGLEIFVS